MVFCAVNVLNQKCFSTEIFQIELFEQSERLGLIALTGFREERM